MTKRTPLTTCGVEAWLDNLASNNKHSHGVEGSEAEDTSLLQCFAGQFLQLSAVNLRLCGLLLTLGAHAQ